GAREIDMSASDHPEETKERPVVVGRVQRDVLILADRDLRQPVGIGVDGPPSDVADQSVLFSVTGDGGIIRSAEPDGWGRDDAVEQVDSGDEKRSNNWRLFSRVGFVRFRESKLKDIDVQDVCGSSD